MRHAARIVIVALACTSSGCVTGITQAIFSSLREVTVCGPPERAWLVEDPRGGQRLVVETAEERDPMMRCMPFAEPMERDERYLPASVVEYEPMNECVVGDDVRAIERSRPRADGEELWPPPTAVAVPVGSLPPHETEVGDALPIAIGRPILFVLQALSLPITVALDVVATPLFFLGCLIFDIVG